MTDEVTNEEVDLDVNDSVLFKAVQGVDRENPVETEDPDDLTFLDEEGLEEAAKKNKQELENEEEEVQSTESDESDGGEGDGNEDASGDNVDKEEEDREDKESDSELQELPESASSEAKESFGKLKASKESWKTKAVETAQQLDDLKSQLDSAPKSDEFEKLQDELNKYKEIVEAEHFQQDPAFIAEYKKPVDTAYGDVVKWAQAGLPSDENKKEAGPNFNLMAEALGDPEKETEYLQAASEVANLIENAAFSSRFLTAAEKWFNAGKNYNQAIGEKEETQKYLAQKRKDRMDRERKTVTGILDSSISDWERNNVGIVDFYKKDKKFNYSEEIKKSKDQANKLFQNFFDTGTVSRELADFVADGGITGGVSRQSQGMMLELIQANVKLIEQKNKEIKERDEQLEALGGKRRKSSSGNNYKDLAKGNDSDVDEKHDSVLVGALSKVRKN